MKLYLYITAPVGSLSSTMTSRQDPDHHIRNLKFDFEATKIVAFEDPESEMKEYYWLAPFGSTETPENLSNVFFSGQNQDPTFKLDNNSNQLLLVSISKSSLIFCCLFKLVQH